MKKIKHMDKLLPIYKIERDCILSKGGDITVAFQVELPEIFTLAGNDFEALHHTWIKAIRVLPNNAVVHKQDWFVEAKYRGDFLDADKSFLSQSSECHFHERPYLDHRCFLFLTKKPDGKRFPNSLFSNLIRPNIVPSQTIDDRIIEDFLDKASQFAKILQSSGYIDLRQLTEDQLASTEQHAGLLEQYCSLLQENETPVIRDLCITPDTIKVGDLYCSLFTLADVEDLPALCGPRINYDRYSTDKSKFSVSFATPLAQMLDCNHIYNQFIVIDDAAATLKKLESRRLRLQSLSTYSRENAISKEAVNKFLNEAISQQRLPIKAHFNIFSWSDDMEKAKDIRNKVSAAMAQMDARTKHETVGAAQIYWASMPGNAGELPANETFDTFCEQATCFFNMETSYRTSLSPIGIRLADRINGIPVHVDLSDEPMSHGVITNRSKFILGPSGSGKSFFTNLLLRSYVEQGSHAVVVDVGHSYRGLCELLDGYYFAYSEKEPIQFNPFINEDEFDIEKRESIKTLLLALWKKDDESFSRSEYVALSNALQDYFIFLKSNPLVFPGFNSFYEYLKEIFVEKLRQEGIKEKDFDIDNLLYVLRPFYKGGEYDYLLNAQKNLDLLQQKFIVFELDNIKSNEILFSTVTLTVMETILNKMRKLKGVRKIVLIEEAWKSIMKQGMAEYIKYLFKTMRKFYGEPIIVTQEVEDITSSNIIKDAIINNSDCKILLDQSKYANKFDHIQQLLGLTEKEKTLILSMNKANDPKLKYKEVFISLGGTISKVYRTEVSLEEYLCYTTEEKEKVKVQAYAKKYGSIKRGIAMLASHIRKNIS